MDKNKNILFYCVFNVCKYTYISTLYLTLFASYIITIFFSLFLIPIARINQKTTNLNKDVFIGLVDVAHQSQDIALCLKKIGYNPNVFFTPMPFAGKSLYNLSGEFLKMPLIDCRFPYLSFFLTKIYLCFYFLRFFLIYDHFVLLFRETFLPLSIDCALLKIAGKNVSRCFFGDDIRYRPIQWKIDTFLLGSPPWISSPSVSSNLLFLRCFFTLYILKIFNVKYSGDYNTCTLSQAPFYEFFVLVHNKLSHKKNTNDIPYVLFCPSRPEDKNANFVLKCIDKLKEKDIVKFNFKFLTGITNENVLKHLEKADIVIDQPSTIIARFSAEGLAYQCCVVTNYKKPYVCYEQMPPIIDYGWDEKSFNDNLMFVIGNKKYRQSVMNKTLQYYEDHHSIEACAEKFKRLFLGSDKPFKTLVPEYKELLLKSCENNFQKIIIKIFYNPVSR